ncbi:hypothetical protein [Leptospirillum ferriphilum]|uniref:hypothetical protein n=1 Tax=Leptospirillum ferriphilum TaxID=178606 RepID=UPI0009873468|nr:hypothetical protein [Leptospirillum ferriphilum]OOH80793.1 hypothetical protein BOX30_05495 [Leptospirillum ferriphilum]
MEDIYKIQVSVSLNESIFTRLKTLTAALNKADASVTRLVSSLKSLSSVMKTTGLGTAEVVKNAGRMGTVFGEAAVRTRSLNASLSSTSRHLASVAKLAQDAGASVGGLSAASSMTAIGGRGSRGGERTRRHGMMPPLLPGSIPGMGMFASAGLLGYGLFESAKMQGIINNTLAISGINPGAPGNQSLRKSLIDMIEKASSETGIGTGPLAEGFLRMRQVDSYLPLDTLRELFPTAAKAAMIQQQVHGTSPVETMMALQEYAHMTGIYNPERLKKVMNYANWASSLSPESLPRLLNAASYAMPSGRSMMNVDPDELIESVIFMKAAGVKNTKSGTWLSNAILNTIPKMHGTGLFKTSPQMAALREMGEINAKGVPTAFDAKGVFHPLKMIQIFLQWADHVKATMPKAEALAKITQTAGLAWGKQGARMVALAMSPGYARMLSVLNPKNEQTIGQEFGVLSKNNPLVQGRMLINNLTVLLQKLVDSTIPTLTSTLKQTNDFLSAIVIHPKRSVGIVAHGLNEALNPFEWFHETPRPFGQHSAVIHTHVHLDGKKIAETVSRHMVGRHTHPTGAASSNGAIFPATSGHGG